VHGAVEQYKHERGMCVYAEGLIEAGVPVARLQEFADRLHRGGSMAVLGASLTEADLIPLERELELRTAAQEEFDTQLQGLVEAFQARSKEATRARRATTRKYLAEAIGLSEPISAAEGDSEDAATRRLNPAECLDPLANVKESERFQRLNLPSATDNLLRTTLEGQLDGSGEPFEIPAWVDTTDPRRGQRTNAYEIVGRVGEGSMGIVYLAREEGRPDRPVALKVLPADADSERKGRFKREILANSFFSHPGALDIYDAGETPDGEHFLAMEFFDGHDVGRILQEEVRLMPAVAVHVALQALEPLVAAHESALVHRDVKPENILLSHDRRIAKLMDFGLALIGDLGNFRSKVFETRKFGITGTPHYLSPEQAAEDEVCPPSDLYSLGVVLYHMLSGRLPFDAKSAKGFVMCHMTKPPIPLLEAYPALSSLPPALPTLVAGLLEKEPEDRPTGVEAIETLRELVAALE
jgi:hypothetical protein